MSLHYLLDAYNIIHKVPELTHKDLKEQREWLVRYVENSRPQGSIKNDVVIFFDGRPGPAGRQVSSLAQVVFTQDKSADDRIKEYVEQSSNSKNIIVVTDDRDIQYAIRANGAKVETVNAFLNKQKTAHLKKKSGGESAKDISNRQEQSITSEMKDVWLKKKKD